MKIVDGGEYVGDIVSCWEERDQRMRHGVRQGKGVCTWADGSVYDGEWYDGMRQGKGTQTYTNGKIYVG